MDTAILAISLIIALAITSMVWAIILHFRRKTERIKGVTQYDFRPGRPTAKDFAQYGRRAEPSTSFEKRMQSSEQDAERRRRIYANEEEERRRQDNDMFNLNTAVGVAVAASLLSQPSSPEPSPEPACDPTPSHDSSSSYDSSSSCDTGSSSYDSGSSFDSGSSGGSDSSSW